VAYPTEEFRQLLIRLMDSRKALTIREHAPRIDQDGRVDVELAIVDLLDAAILSLSDLADKAGR
jgi:hypothetical protein